jgi:hypothetical protein
VHWNHQLLTIWVRVLSTGHISTDKIVYCGGIRVSRKASCGRQRAEDKEILRERVLVDEKGTTPLSGGG